MRKLIFIVLLFLCVPLPLHAKIYPSNDIHWLALNIYHETEGEANFKEKLYIAYTVLNRTHSDSFPQTIQKVICQEKQFSWYVRGKYKRPKVIRVWKDCIAVATLALILHNQNSADGALFFHAKNIKKKPKWAYKKKLVANVGGHIFYR
jgi:N-acetylmuramoyl-L-alanine amidase